MGQPAEDNPGGMVHRSHDDRVAGNHQQAPELEEECDHICLGRRSSLVEEGFYHGIRHDVDYSLVVVRAYHSHLGMDDDPEIWNGSDHEAYQAEST
jgi:hypothetical protein